MAKYKAIEKALKQAQEWFDNSSWSEAMKSYKPSEKTYKGIENARKQAEEEFKNSFWKKALEIKEKGKINEKSIK